MKKYKITFEGKELNAIGIMCMFGETIEAENLDNAVLKLYDTHDHIRVITVNGKPYNYNLTFKQFENL